ncbi:tyrosine-protein phosphatase [Shewanella japonica]|uniref:tyrosine-protein phosphatase n=1 Tax=Shewanella japonica TaxID=93973 RepID=UPI0024947AF4|nr:CpsB/CapC family capsule biosynthesis tyrosine phosphatase [Shewanella japonica]
MIDLHCHILPGIDDGAKSIDESIALLQLAAEQGITHVVATPHIHLGIFDNTLASINAAYKLLVNDTRFSQLNLALNTAAEVRICPEIIPFIENSQIPFLGKYQDKDVLLLELPSSHIPPGADKLVRWLVARNIIPMIAHPERNRELQTHPERIQMFQRLGCLFQLTASSLLGDMGEKPLQLSQLFLEQNLYTIIASDSHSINRRPPKLKQAYQVAEKLVGQHRADALVLDNPRAISESLFLKS